MKPGKITVAMLGTMIALAALSLTNVQAGDKQVGGLILGSGTGAIVGQAIGRNTQSTIVGATVGGVVGLLVGSQLENHRGPGHGHSRIVIHSQSYDNHRYDRQVRPVFRDHHKGNYHYDRGDCRKVITVHKGYYGTKRVVSTVCGHSPRHHQPERHPFKFRDRLYH